MKKYYSILLLGLLIFTGTSNVDGSTQMAEIRSCSHPTLTIIGCHEYTSTENLIKDVTIVVMDTALDPDEWRYFENGSDFGHGIDIVQYVSRTEENGQPIQITVDSPDDLEDAYDRSDEIILAPSGFAHHGSKVLSSIAMIAKNVKIVYIAYDMWGPHTGYDLTSMGRSGEITLIYNYILDNLNSWGGIDIITFSNALEYDYMFNEEQSASLAAEGIYMIVATGNDVTQIQVNPQKPIEGIITVPKNRTLEARKYPMVYPDWYAIGAIEENGLIADFSNYGTEEYGDQSVDFVMPGVGVPVHTGGLAENGGTWTYEDGTSFSAPYFAATVAILIDQYQGIYGVNPSISTITETLQIYSSRSSFDYLHGWGFVNINNIFHAFDTTDADQDHITDIWESQNNLDPLDPADALMDFDGDGLNNLEEYWALTDPWNPNTDGDFYDDKWEVDHVSLGLDPLVINDRDQKPNQPAKPVGPTTVIKGSDHHQWTFNVIDPDSDVIYFEINWGDYSPLQIVQGISGEDLAVTHKFTWIGYKYITVKAYSIDYGQEELSDQSLSLRVYVKNPPGGGGGPMGFVPIPFAVGHSEKIEHGSTTEISKYDKIRKSTRFKFN